MTGGRRPHLLLALLGAAVGVLLVRNVTGADAWPGWTTYVYNAIELGAVALCAWRAAMLRAERAAWTCMAIALALFTAGDLAWAAYDPETIPYPSVADALYLAFFPFAYAGLGLLIRARTGRRAAARWLDGLIAMLAIAGLFAALVLDPLVDDSGDTLAVATNLAYPIGDLGLLAVVVGLVTTYGVRAARTWLVLAAGLALFAVADTLYLAQVARGTYVPDGLLDVAWPVALLLFAVAAWQPAAVAERQSEGLRRLTAPSLAGLAAIGLVVYDHYHRVNDVGLWLAASALAVLVARFALTYVANQRMLAASEHEARTDALTGLANRRALMDALGRTVDHGRPAVVALFDLDGFKSYNDRFGHPAGDALLQRLARRLEAATANAGRAFRIGGDEFCLLLDVEGADAALAAASEGLSEHGDGFAITASHGAVRVPEEAADATHILSLVDQRMYAAKGRTRASAVSQTRDVLLRAVEERKPELGGHVGDVAGLAVRVAKAMRLGAEAVDQVRAAAELHDVGKLAVPDAILDKPGPLDPEEWSFMHRHTIVGERILLAAPALAAVAPLVRSSHERWDGGGYPDGLAGEAIPLGARIVSLCDAFDAMITDRPYRAAISVYAALDELRRCAGTQFDPAVVAAFETVLRRQAGAALAA